MTFAAVVVKQNWIDIHVVLSQRLKNQRFRKIESLSPRSHVHHFRVQSLKELDREVMILLKESYQVGKQAYLKT